jgi:predicted transposase YdaD
MPKPYDDAMKKLVGGNPQDLVSYNYLPVYSCVIYLKNHASVPRSPFTKGLPNGEEVVRFHYRSIELGKLVAGELLQTGLVGLLPLLPLTQDGARREVVEEMISGLVSAEKTESLWIGYALASKVMDDDLKWLKRRFAMLEDILRDTPLYQEVLAEGMEKGLEEGLEKGREEGKLEAQRQTFLDVVQERFPAIVRLAKQQADAIQDPEVLRHLTVKISVVKTSREAEQYLLNPSSLENRH